MWASFISVFVVLGFPFAQSSSMTDYVPVITAAEPSADASADVRDPAGVFGRDAVRGARGVLSRIDRTHLVPVRIETIGSLDGAWIADVARRRARTADAAQLYVLIAPNERDVGVVAARHGPASRLTDQHRGGIRRAFLEPLQAGKPDEALERGVQEIAAALASVATSRPGLVGWAPLTAFTIVAALVIVAVSRARERQRFRRGTAATAGAPGRADTPVPREKVPARKARRLELEPVEASS